MSACEPAKSLDTEGNCCNSSSSDDRRPQAPHRTLWRADSRQRKQRQLAQVSTGGSSLAVGRPSVWSSEAIKRFRAGSDIRISRRRRLAKAYATLKTSKYILKFAICSSQSTSKVCVGQGDVDCACTYPGLASETTTSLSIAATTLESQRALRNKKQASRVRQTDRRTEAECVSCPSPPTRVIQRLWVLYIPQD